MILPPSLTPFAKEAARWVKKGAIADLDFSGPTYQVLVRLGAREEHWVFLQLGEKCALVDSFCTCEGWENENACLHVAIAYLGLFRDDALPLHERFSRSLWNCLCQIYESGCASQTDVFKRLSQTQWSVRAPFDKMLALLKARSQAGLLVLEEILHAPIQETEETSLKFSGLSAEEVAEWRLGTPPPKLRYELSPWSRLAKWIFHLQESGEEYLISFRFGQPGLPNWIQIDFASVEIGFYLSEAHLALVIPALAFVKSPLVLFPAESSSLEKIRYDEARGVILLQHKQHSALDLPEGLPIGDWIFVKNAGFYPKTPQALLQKEELVGKEIEEALSLYGDLFAPFLHPITLSGSSLQRLSYSLSFDAAWNLEIEPFVRQKGDLTSPASRLFGCWAYLSPSREFCKISPSEMGTIKRSIPSTEVASFLSQHRSWFYQQEGFQPHMKSLDYQLGYQVDKKGLQFVRVLVHPTDGHHSHDFHPWVYVEGQGFYMKGETSFPSRVKPGLIFSPEKIPLFIRAHREELALIDGFFLDESPLLEVSVEAQLLSNGAVQLLPHYQLAPWVDQTPFFLFEEFLYVQDYGFYELPPDCRLPDGLTHPIEILREEVDAFFAEEWPRYQAFLRKIDPRLQPPQGLKLEVYHVEACEERGNGWHRIRGHYRSESGVVPLLTLHRALQKRQRFVPSDAGLLDLTDPRFAWLSRFKERWRKEESSLVLSNLEFIRLHAFEPILLSHQERSSSLFHIGELLESSVPEKPMIDHLPGRLRPYQNLGLQWLWFLYRHRLSGLLCDEMGLGKTHQAIALLAGIAGCHAEFPRFLIICPTSVLYHWEEKLKSGWQDAKVHCFYGPHRAVEELQGALTQPQIVLSSYGILRNSIQDLAKIPFEAAIFDEIQLAKNQQSLVCHALRKIQAKMKLGLTGTPIENRLRELKTLFDVVLPGYLPGDKEFRELFVKPIEKEGDPQQQELLNRLIKPFVLRRKKTDVLRELPEKVEETCFCDLSPQQQELYTDTLTRRRDALLANLTRPDAPIPYLHIFSLLSQLKQICNHPALFLKQEENYQDYTSGKWELFVELLHEALESNQKVIVFSQFLGMLDIIEAYLTSKKIRFAGIRGATQDRQKQLERFQKDPKCLVFVGSLQAAGLGIDLTAASVVILYDRWWNAAKETQATDRAHRIGQKRSVLVFKLITKNSFEEKIDQMIERKSRLMEEVVGSDEQSTLKVFSREELIELLRFNST